MFECNTKQRCNGTGTWALYFPKTMTMGNRSRDQDQCNNL